MWSSLVLKANSYHRANVAQEANRHQHGMMFLCMCFSPSAPRELRNRIAVNSLQNCTPMRAISVTRLWECEMLLLALDGLEGNESLGKSLIAHRLLLLFYRQMF